MAIDSRSILVHLDAVAIERKKRQADPGLQAGVRRIKQYQQQRFSHTYADLLSSPRYGAAAHFFLDELYGPRDFTERDQQFARVVPALVRLFPQQIVEAVATLAELHALSEALDTVMATHTDATAALDAMAYLRAWRATGSEQRRERQIALTLEVGASLDRLTRKPLLHHSLRLMRPAARAAGLGDLQTFLEAGFDTFRAMRGAQEFLAIVDAREHRLGQALFGVSGAVADPSNLRIALAQLPGDEQGAITYR